MQCKGDDVGIHEQIKVVCVKAVLREGVLQIVKDVQCVKHNLHKGYQRISEALACAA